MIGVNEYLPGALVAGAAFAVLWATSRRPCRCQDCQPVPPAHHETPTQARIIRRGSGRELERWDGR